MMQVAIHAGGTISRRSVTNEPGALIGPARDRLPDCGRTIRFLRRPDPGVGQHAGPQRQAGSGKPQLLWQRTGGSALGALRPTAVQVDRSSTTPPKGGGTLPKPRDPVRGP